MTSVSLPDARPHRVGFLRGPRPTGLATDAPSGPFFAPPLRADGLAVDSPTGNRPILHNPVIRALILVAALVLGLGGGSALPTLLHAPASVVMVSATVGTVVLYLLVVILIEGRRPFELAPRRWPGLLIGLGLGAALFTLSFGILLAAGAYRIAGIHTDLPWALGLLSLGLRAGVTEEIILRAGLHRLVEQGLGTWGATAVSAVVFGAAHLTNPDATLWGAIAIAIEAGISFGLLYSLTRSLWVVMGLHAAWNVTQGMIFGAAVSGTGETISLFDSVPIGPDLLTGGDFGPEASIVSVLVLVAFSAVLAYALVRRGLVVAPLRQRWRAPGHPRRPDATPRFIGHESTRG